MIRFMEVIRAAVPLLIAAGAAITAAGVYYFSKRRGDGESTTATIPTATAPTQGQTLYEDSSSMDPDSMSFQAGVNITHSTDYEDSLVLAERRYEKVLELCYKKLRKKHKKVVQAHGNLKVHYNRMKEEYNEFLKKHEQEQLCLAQAMESNARLEKENIDLLAQMSTLRCTMRQLKEEFVEARRRFVEKRQEQEQDLGTGTLNLRLIIMNNEERLAGSLAEIESKLMKAININCMLTKDRAYLNYHVRVLRDTVQELEEMLSDSERKYNTVKQDKEQLMQVHNMLKMRHNKMLETLHCVTCYS